MDQCFVIQPFDQDTFDKRYNDTFKSAIKEAGLEPYRVDNDPDVRVPIETIEQNIRNSKICFAEITTNNPNVWYELGYAFALKKDVVMVCCTDERKEAFPFDVRHKHITTYKASSVSDFTNLSTAITSKIKAYLSSSKVTENLSASPVVDMEGLASHEIALLIIILENQLTELDTLSTYQLNDYMNRIGFTNAATSISLRTLKNKGMIEIIKNTDFNGYDYIACQLTNLGEKWLLNNQDKVRLRIENNNQGNESNSGNNSQNIEDDLPF